MSLSAGALQLAGFLLAHGVWTIAEQPAGERYVPQALCETAAGERRLISFDAATPDQSLADARGFMGSAAGQFAECAVARQADVAYGEGRTTPALVIELTAAGSDVTIVQAYRSASATDGFRLLGDEVLLDTRGQPLSHGDTNAGIAALREGAADHPGIEERWQAWNSGRDPSGPLAM